MSEQARARRVRAVVRGRVQNVGFRAFVAQHARSLGLTGAVANEADRRTVTVEAQGDPERVALLLELLRQGPLGARVESVEHGDQPPVAGETGFRVR